jgi:hypothetical protein
MERSLGFVSTCLAAFFSTGPDVREDGGRRCGKKVFSNQTRKNSFLVIVIEARNMCQMKLTTKLDT